MAKKPRLPPEKWEEIIKKHVLDKVPVRQLARDYGVDESTIREKLKKGSPQNPAPAGDRIEKAAQNAIEAAKSVGLNQSELNVALELAYTSETLRTRLNEYADNNADAATVLSRHIKAKVKQLGTPEGPIDLDQLKQLAGLIEISNKAAYGGHKRLEAEKEKDDKPVREIILINAPEE